jgi:hypothetical protein
VKFAEAFGFGRANRAGAPDLALSSPDGESRRPVGKGEGRGNPKGKLAWACFLGYVFCTSKKGNSPSKGETNAGCHVVLKIELVALMLRIVITILSYQRPKPVLSEAEGPLPQTKKSL